MTIRYETDGTPNDGNVQRPNVTSRVTDHLFAAPCDNKGVDSCNHHKFVAPCDNIVASHDNTGTDTDALEFVAPRDNLGSTYSGRVFFWPFLQRGVLLPCSTTLLLPVSMRSNKDEVPLPMARKGQRPDRTRARCLFTGEVQRRTFLPARNIFVVLLRRRRTYERARAPRFGASPPNPPL